MNRRYVIYAIILGAVAAWLLWQGPAAVQEVAEQVVGFVMRTIGAKEQANRLALLPEVRDELDSLREELAETWGIETFIGQTKRSADYQRTRIDAGLSDTEDSWHLLGRAVDLYPIDPETGQWDGAGRTWNTLYRTLHDVAARRGWRGIAFTGPGGQGNKRYLRSGAWDGGHLEFRGPFATWAAAARAQGYVG